MFSTRTRTQRPDQARPIVDRRAAPTGPGAPRTSALLDLAAELPWLGPSPHWVSDIDGSRLRTSLQTRGFTLFEFGYQGITSEEALLADLQVSLGLPVEARTGWPTLCDAIRGLFTAVNGPIT